jgi:dipeptidyl aminopeptidase/acylaminoacyl peptidase
MTQRVAAYGSWKSPITSDLIVQGTIGFGQIELGGQAVYWTEGRPAEGGRNVVVRRRPGEDATDLTPAPFNARSRVHEYGGGAFAVAGGTVYFCNDADQRLYRRDPGGEPAPLTPAAALRYADMVIDQRRGRIICVREDHRATGAEAANTLVSIDLERGGEGQVIASGNDFYSSPRLSPDGSRLAWLAWNHPSMPWDGSELWVAEILADGSPAHAQRVAGGRSESIFQPDWSPDGVLHYASDRSGWWNLYRWGKAGPEPLCEIPAEFGKPQWVLGMSTYAFESAGRIICAYAQEGTWHLASLDTAQRRLEPIETPCTEISQVRAQPGRVVFIGGSPSEAPAVLELNLSTGKIEVLRRSSRVAIEAGYLSRPQAIEFPTAHGLTARGYFYPPHNGDHSGPAGERPPLLVTSHGGPTGSASTDLNLSIQFWTTRGIAVLDVDYGGSSGYGRAYRERLNGQWGVVDVDDCANGARYLAERGLVDGRRLAIRGGSAGGYTTLAALTFRDVFQAGASYYGVSDLEALARETHKFESRYLDRLIGPYPEQCDLYRQRSPICHVGRLSCPVIFFQGLEDRVVPPNQAEMMVQALRSKGVPVAYIAFEGEQHGFRRAEHIKRALDAELCFYSRIFGFQLAEPVEPVPIENL